VDELIALLQSDDACTVCRKERRTYLFEGEKVSMCLSCYAMKALKDLAPVEVDYIERVLPPVKNGPTPLMHVDPPGSCMFLTC
jgi:hypothetical protein